jgi:transcriptional regulator with XRE-family HTH domain
MDSLEETFRKLRVSMKLSLQIVAAFLGIVQVVLSKIEGAIRNASSEYVVKLAEFFKVIENTLLVSWLSDKLVYEVADEYIALKAVQVLEEK